MRRRQHPPVGNQCRAAIKEIHHPRPFAGVSVSSRDDLRVERRNQSSSAQFRWGRTRTWIGWWTNAAATGRLSTRHVDENADDRRHHH